MLWSCVSWCSCCASASAGRSVPGLSGPERAPVSEPEDWIIGGLTLAVVLLTLLIVALILYAVLVGPL